MERIEKSIDVGCPVRTVYNQWTQFEDFPKFMDGVKDVRQVDDTHVHWHAEVWGKDKEWDAEITEQVPDERISWRSVSGALNAGTVRFEPLGPDRTRVRLVMAYEPEGAIENIGDALGVMSGRVEHTVKDFKKFIEQRGQETGAWRGEVHDSKKQGSPSAAGGGRTRATGGGRSAASGSRGTSGTAGARGTNPGGSTSEPSGTTDPDDQPGGGRAAGGAKPNGSWPFTK
jgi:ribosome-associated toxin RatA of RatAB toxin-antitoxin module